MAWKLPIGALSPATMVVGILMTSATGTKSRSGS
jgi:hypothetical protein